MGCQQTKTTPKNSGWTIQNCGGGGGQDKHGETQKKNKREISPYTPAPHPTTGVIKRDNSQKHNRQKHEKRVQILKKKAPIGWGKKKQSQVVNPQTT